MRDFPHEQSEPKIIMQQVKYRENIEKTKSKKDIKLAHTYEDKSTSKAPVKYI